MPTSEQGPILSEQAFQEPTRYIESFVDVVDSRANPGQTFSKDELLNIKQQLEAEQQSFFDADLYRSKDSKNEDDKTESNQPTADEPVIYDQIVEKDNLPGSEIVDEEDDYSLVADPNILPAPKSKVTNAWPAPNPADINKPKELTPEQQLKISREKLAELSVVLRGKYSSNFNEELKHGRTLIEPTTAITRAEKLKEKSAKLKGKLSKNFNEELSQSYDQALEEYTLAYEGVNKNSIAKLKASGMDDATIVTLLSFANEQEHRQFSDAEKEAFYKQNPKVGKAANYWARLGIVKRSLLGGAGGMAVTTVATGLVAATGVGVVAGGVAVLSVKAAKSIGLYKLNKNSNKVQQFDKNALQDNQAIVNLTPSLETDDLDTATAWATNVLANSLRTRVELDQKENRKRLAIALGAVAAGALLGLAYSYAHDAKLPTVGQSAPKPSSSTVPNTTIAVAPTVPKPSVSTTIPSVKTTTVPSHSHFPSSTTNPDNPHHTLPAKPLPPAQPAVPPQPAPPVAAPVTPELPAQVTTVDIAPTPPVVLPNLNYSAPTWAVAHQFEPGHEVEVMQRGIAAFNNAHLTHFALTPHNGSTWIIDNGRSINPAEMNELNHEMIFNELVAA